MMNTIDITIVFMKLRHFGERELNSEIRNERIQ